MVFEIWNATDKISCHFRPFFALLPHSCLKYQNFEKIKKTPRDIIILHMCTINYNHMMYGSWDILSATDRIFCNFGQFFAHLPPKNPKSQHFEKMKKNAWRYYHFTQVYQKSGSYAVLFLRYDVWQMSFLFLFWIIFCTFTPL